jgi:hypothetical protein
MKNPNYQTSKTDSLGARVALRSGLTFEGRKKPKM